MSPSDEACMMERSSCKCYTSHEYTQILYDALDSMARSIEKRLATQGGTVLVSLGVHDSLYHKVSFRDQLREKSETACLLTQCHSKWFPSADGWNNEHFVYARRTFEGAENTPGSFMDSIFSERFLGVNFLGFNFGLGDAAESSSYQRVQSFFASQTLHNRKKFKKKIRRCKWRSKF